MDEPENEHSDDSLQPVQKRPRRSTRLKVKMKFSERIPLQTKNTNSSFDGNLASSPAKPERKSWSKKSVSPASTADIQRDSECWSFESYCQFLESNILPELYQEIKKHVLDTIKSDEPRAMIEEKVIEFLKSGGDTVAPVPTPVAAEELEDYKPSRNRRRTADREIIEVGHHLLSGSSPQENLRRSKRLRKSLCVYKEQRIVHKLYEVPGSTNDQSARSQVAITESQASTLGLEPGFATCTIDAQQLTETHDARPEKLYQTETHNACLEEAYQTETPEDEVDKKPHSPDLHVNEELLSIYLNKNYSVVSSNGCQTVYEVPRKYRGDVVLFSRESNKIGFDFSEGCWYRVPTSKINQRKRKARLRGYAPATGAQAEKYEELLKQSLHRLDNLTISHTSNSSVYN